MTASFRNQITEMEADRAKLSAHWCVGPETARLLYILTLAQGATTVLEIGTSIGYSTVWFAGALDAIQRHNSNAAGKIYTLDASAERQRSARLAVEKAGLSHRVEFITGQALTELERLKTHSLSVDIAFIDAAKAEYLAYAQAITPMLCAGGLLIADNTRSHRDKMLPFIDWITTHPDYEISDLETPTGQLIARKKEPLEV